ncbi:MAG: 50S ribosomal protein L9 [Rhodobacteraceae bacterium]|nr:50S ribosomal protein L9 [Paracoccaceae bacterium]
MEVILLERIQNLGLMGDKVKVKPGFARNYLFPQKKALKNTDENRKFFEETRIEIEARNLELKKEADAISEKINAREFVLVRQASETGSLYGSVTKRDIAESAIASGLTIDRNQIELDKPIKEIGLHDVRVVLHPEVVVSIIVNVARSTAEAENQSKTIAEENNEEFFEKPAEVEEVKEDSDAAESINSA